MLFQPAPLMFTSQSVTFPVKPETVTVVDVLIQTGDNAAVAVPPALAGFTFITATDDISVAHTPF